MGKTFLIVAIMIAVQFLVTFMMSKSPEKRTTDSLCPLDASSLIIVAALILRMIWGITTEGLELNFGWGLLSIFIIGIGGALFFDRKNPLISSTK